MSTHIPCEEEIRRENRLAVQIDERKEEDSDDDDDHVRIGAMRIINEEE